MENKQLIIIVLSIIIAACIIGCAVYLGLSHENNTEIATNSSNETNTTINVTDEDNTEIDETVDDNDDENGPVYEESYYKGGVAKHESENGNDGWNPSEHETYREDMGDGNYKIHYDDGYFRVCDRNGYIITYGY